jgi:hypothetical protein
MEQAVSLLGPLVFLKQNQLFNARVDSYVYVCIYVCMDRDGHKCVCTVIMLLCNMGSSKVQYIYIYIYSFYRFSTYILIIG